MDNKNLFSIGEIAKAVGVTRKNILNYEVKGLITPDKKDGTTGNRYYSIDIYLHLIRDFQDILRYVNIYQLRSYALLVKYQDFLLFL